MAEKDPLAIGVAVNFRFIYPVSEISDWFKKNRNLGVCSFAFEFDNGGCVHFGGAACHYDLKTVGKYHPSRIVAVWSSLRFEPLYVSQGQAELYWNGILFDANSPWRLLSNKDTCRVYHDDNGKPLCFRLAVDDETNSNVLATLMIATRAPLEHTANVLLWVKAYEEGFTSAQCCVLYTYLSLDYEHKHIVSAPNGGWHFPFKHRWTRWSSFRDGFKAPGNFKRGVGYASPDELPGGGDFKFPLVMLGNEKNIVEEKEYVGAFCSFLRQQGYVSAQNKFLDNKPKQDLYDISLSLKDIKENSAQFFPMAGAV